MVPLKQNIKKAWTPDNCPLRVGSVLYDTEKNVDIMVVERYLNYDDEDVHNSNQFLKLVKLGNGKTLTGNEMLGGRYEWYKEWPYTGTTVNCFDVLLEAK